MPLEVEVMTEDNHITIVRIENTLESPKVGDFITCGRCNRKQKIRSVGTPSRVTDEGHPIDPNQNSLLK